MNMVYSNYKRGACKMIRHLGRWSRKKKMLKVDFANHDHCGSNICRTSFVSNHYDNAMDVSLSALQSFHLNPSGVLKNKDKIQKK